MTIGIPCCECHSRARLIRRPVLLAPYYCSCSSCGRMTATHHDKQEVLRHWYHKADFSLVIILEEIWA